MVSHRLSLILPLAMLPALIGCGGPADPAPPEPLSDQAIEAVVARPGVKREALARAIDALFSADDAGETRAFIVMRGGTIVGERYAEGYGRDTRLVGWSMGKCITGVMAGLLVADGRLRLDETAPVPAWQRSGDPRGEITLRQLLQMRSGLRHTENGDPLYASDEVRMLFLDGRDNMAGYAEAQPLEAEPGRRFEYSSATTNIIADLAARVLTSSEDPGVRQRIVADYLATRIFEPNGMRSMVPEFDARGTLIGSSLIHGSARDWAKFGEFLRHGGAVRGAQLVPRGWIEFMTAPSPRNPAYGGQVWLNRPSTVDQPDLFPDRAPASLFACIGHLGQYVIVSPEQQLTVVRLGKTDSPARAALARRLGDIVALFPKVLPESAEKP